MYVDPCMKCTEQCRFEQNGLELCSFENIFTDPFFDFFCYRSFEPCRASSSFFEPS